jgi:hypothetical protein
LRRRLGICVHSIDSHFETTALPYVTGCFSLSYNECIVDEGNEREDACDLEDANLSRAKALCRHSRCNLA